MTATISWKPWPTLYDADIPTSECLSLLGAMFDGCSQQLGTRDGYGAVTHLLAALMREHDPRLLALVLLEALLGSGSATRGLLTGRSGWIGRMVAALVFGAVTTLTSGLVFFTAVAGTYSQLSLHVPFRWAASALALSMLSASAAGIVHLASRRSARNTMLAGSLLACGFSCMLFTGMAGVVSPFALAYNLTGLMVVMMLGAALCAFALWELGNPERRRPKSIAAVLISAATTVLAFGSLAAVLRFDEWLNAVAQPDDLASSPIVIIVAAEAVGVLVLSLLGSLVDNRVAARDRVDAERFRQLADSTLEGILIHRDGEILDANESLASLLGMKLVELRSHPLARFVVAGSDMSIWSPEQGGLPAETEILAMDNSLLPVEILSRSITYGGYSALVTAVRDVRERRISEKRIHFLAHHDVLTELPNRAFLNESLELALLLAARSQAPIAILCLDLDGFKSINDTLGHAAGDQVLCQVADRLRDNLRESDFVARVGGDEFVVLQTTGAQPEEAATLAQRIVDCLKPSFRVDGQTVNIGTSIGIALHPSDGHTATILLKKADIALYRAKDGGRARFCLFEPGMDLALQQRQALESELRNALQNDEFTLHFQPLFDRSYKLVAFEALVRWNHPSSGLVSPARFIPVAEECGLIVPIGEWVMRSACTAAMTWDHDCRVAVNLSPAQFERGDVPKMVATVLRETGLAPCRLELEITEGFLVDNTDAAFEVLTALRNLGVRLVLDDFGTGYSSLSYLQRFPFEKLKIDRSFVQHLEKKTGSRAIVRAIIAMSRSLDLEVTAEGVETVEQFDFLCAQGCDELQGFLLSRPIPMEAITAFLRRHAKEERPSITDGTRVSTVTH